MSQQNDHAYLARAITRIEDRTKRQADAAFSKVQSEAAAAGAFQGSAAIRLSGKAYERAFRDGVGRMVQLAFDVRNGFSPEASDIIRAAADRVRNVLIREIENHYSKRRGALSYAWAAVRDSFAAAARSIVDDALNDYRHGILNGKPLRRADPIGSIIGSNTSMNSPGSVQQAGTGTGNLVRRNSNELVTELRELVESSAVQKLSANDCEAIVDLVEVIETEARASSPDESKIRRWGKRLLDICERFGVAVDAGLTGKFFGG